MSAQALGGICAPIARQLARANVRTVAFVPAPRAMVAGASLAPLICGIGEALLGFVSGQVGIIDAWPTWRFGEVVERGARSIYRRRSLAPRIIELAPLPCGDPEAASLALRATLETRPPELVITLVNLADYAKPGVVPSAAEIHDGVVLIAARGRTLRGGVGHMARFVAPEKSLGTILVD